MNDKNLKHIEKGQVLNPNGRKKGSKNRKTILKKWLSIEVNETLPDGSCEIITLLDKIVLEQIKSAMKGETPAYKEIMDGVYGKIKDELNIDAKSTVIDMSTWK